MAKQFKPETLCVQAGWTPKKGEPRVLPIYQSTTFKYDTSEQMARLFDLEDSGYFYTRLQNPTNDAVAAKIAALEGGVAAMLTSSGQAANFYAIFNICQAGDHFVCSSAIYGGTFNLFGVTMKNSVLRLLSSIRMPAKKKFPQLSVRIRKHCSVKLFPILLSKCWILRNSPVSLTITEYL